MGRKELILAAALTSALAFSSCKDLFTTSVGGPFERDAPSISSSSSVGDLLDIASDWGSDKDTAGAVLNALSSKDPATITALDMADKTAILNLATDASIDIASLSDLAKEAVKTDADTNDLVERTLASFDTSVNTAAVEALLADTATLESAPADTLVMASSVILASVAKDIGTEAVMDIMANPSTVGTAGLTPEQEAQINLVIGVVDAIDARPEGSNTVTFGDFDITKLLRGNQ